MPNKSLSVAKEDEPLWTQGEGLARSARQSMSGYVLSLIEQDVAARDGAEETVVDGAELCEAPMHEPGYPRWRESFTGKWLDDAGSFVDATHAETGLTWYLGITVAGRPVAYRTLPSVKQNDYEKERLEKEKGWSPSKCESLLQAFDSADEMREAIVPQGFPEHCFHNWTEALASAAVIHHSDW